VVTIRLADIFRDCLANRIRAFLAIHYDFLHRKIADQSSGSARIKLGSWFKAGIGGFVMAA
jgi:hypothetical protein